MEASIKNSLVARKNLFISHRAFFSATLVLKLIVTLMAIYLYARVSPFSDAEGYLRSSLSAWDFSLFFNRTLFVSYIYASLKYILFYDILVHLFVSSLFTVVLIYVFKPEYYFLDKTLFISSLLLPHFLIWSGVVGKEILGMTGFFLIIKVSVDLVIWKRVRVFPLIIGLFLTLIVRPHYALCYIYLFSISFIIAKSKTRVMGIFSSSKSFLILLLLTAYCLALMVYLEPFYDRHLINFMQITRIYFLTFTKSAANRWDITWDNAGDFVSNLPWGLPLSIIGPTWSEALQRPMFLPVFLEGCFAGLLLILIACMLIRFIKRYPEYSSLIIWGFIPAVLLGLLINYPFGIFNPGSAIRYKQSLSPLLYFYPLLLIAAVKRKKYLEAQTKKFIGL